MVMIYDIDINLDPKEIPVAIAKQNISLGIPVNNAGNYVKPLFKKGPRDGKTVFWVCEISPELYKPMVGNRIYIELSSCKVVEFFGYLQCLACQKFGHREIYCKADKLVCSYCSEIGHRENVCARKDKPPKCANCKGPHTTIFPRCKERINAINRVVRITKY